MAVSGSASTEAVEAVKPNTSSQQPLETSVSPAATLEGAVELGTFAQPFSYTVVISKTNTLHVKSGAPMNKKLPKDSVLLHATQASLFPLNLFLRSFTIVAGPALAPLQRGKVWVPAIPAFA